MKRRFWFVCIIILLVSSCLFTACSEGGEDASESQKGEGGGEGGKGSVKISILASAGDTTGYAVQAYKPESDPYVKELSRLSGYDLNMDFLGHLDYNKQLTVRFASNDLADMIRTPSILSANHPGAVEQGIFKELGPLIDKYGPNLKKNISEVAWNDPRVSKDGKIYGIPTFFALKAPRVTYIRQDWLDKLKMDTPKSIDDFLAFFEAVKKNDMNGDGEQNEYGLYVRENLAYSDFFFKSVSGVSMKSWTMVDGQMLPDIIRPEMKEAIAFWKMLYDEGYINPNLFTNKSADWSAGIKKGYGGMWAHDVPNYQTGWAPSQFVNQPGVELSMIEPPQGPGGSGILPESSGIYFVWVIPDSVSDEKAAEIIKFLDWCWSSDEAAKFFAYGIKGYNYTEENGKVDWDANDPHNDEYDQKLFYRVRLNMTGDGRMSPLVLEVEPEAAKMKKGVEVAAKSIYPHDDLNMPTLEALKTHPELVPKTKAGTLFLDMFAKVVTGQEELDPAFDKFVKDWKSRGGDAAIKEATDWYNKTH